MRTFTTLLVRFVLGGGSLVLIWLAIYSLEESRDPDLRPGARLVLISAILISVLLSAAGSKFALVLKRVRAIDALAFVAPFLAPPVTLFFVSHGASDATFWFWCSISGGAAIVAFGTDYLIRRRCESKAPNHSSQPTTGLAPGRG